MTTPPDAVPRPSNRLARSTSPYLLQHAHNPVEWYPWGPEAIEAARARDVPIFLSVGYSTCYWCHVMERECFEHPDIAKQMNAGFVNIKLDREQRPDLDDLYMVAVQMLTGHGGWPMSVFLDPRSLRPFFAGTYFPPVPARGMPGFAQVLSGMSQAWSDQRAEVLSQAGAVAEAVRQRLDARQQPVRIGSEHVAGCVRTLLTLLDRVDGGFGRAPKFPQPVYLEFLLAARERVDEGSRGAIDAGLTLTLDRMGIGGIFDHLAGGFHRYSVDAHWLVPHFEKMLYDQGLLIGVYAQASLVLGDTVYAQVARRTGEFVLREMTAPQGGFYTAIDAEVNGREGLNYLWTAGEIDQVLAAPDASWAKDVFGLIRGPNFQDPHHQGEPARSVLRLDARPDQLAHRLGMSLPAFEQRLDAVRQRLVQARSRRPQPRLDDKVLVSWNGMMIQGLARAGTVLDEPAFVHAAARAGEFILAHLRDAQGELLRTWRQGHAQIPALLEDYAHLACGLLELHRAGARRSDGSTYLAHAGRLIDRALELFGDPGGSVHDARAGEGDLFVRARGTYDGATPSASSVLLHALIDLVALTGEGTRFDRAMALLASLSGAIAESPVAAANSVRGLLRLLVLKPEGVKRVLEQAPPGAGETPALEVYASQNEVVLEGAEPVQILLRLEIPGGWHINDGYAADESAGALVPLHVNVVGGAGVRAYADYPQGEVLPGAGHRVHRGCIELPVALERDGEWTGSPRLVVSYQLCSDHACLAPGAVELDVELRRG